jgi:hypothetical protein
MDSYLENAMDYAQEAFESANEWMKENDPFTNFGLLGAEAHKVEKCHKTGNGDEVCYWVETEHSKPWKPNGGGVSYTKRF